MHIINTICFFSILFINCLALKVYKSTAILKEPNVVSGLHYKNILDQKMDKGRVAGAKILAQTTVAVWTPQKFFPLLIRPQGSQGCQKITFFLQMKVFSFCAKIAPKRHKLQKPSKLKKKCQKNYTERHQFY